MQNFGKILIYLGLILAVAVFGFLIENGLLLG